MAFSTVGFSQIRFGKTDPKCEEGWAKAERDFKRGVRRIYLFGLVPDAAYGNALNKKHDIEVQYQGCLVAPELKCYSDRMEAMIEEERGIGFFEKVKTDVNGKKATEGL
jgi:hypothetical protein